MGIGNSFARFSTKFRILRQVATDHALSRASGALPWWRVEEIAKRLSIHQATVTRALADLADDGLVTVNRHEEWSLTYTGQHLLKPEDRLASCRLCGRTGHLSPHCDGCGEHHPHDIACAGLDDFRQADTAVFDFSKLEDAQTIDRR